MKQFIFTILIVISFFKLFGQTEYYETTNRKGDSIKIEIIQNPTVCDCIKSDWRNKKQKKVCSLVYDYDFMSEEEQKEYDKQKSICQYPSICDCANVTNKNKGLLKACNSRFNYNNISKEQLEKHIQKLEKCPKVKKEEIEICDCINVDNYKLKQKCNETFFNDSLISESKRVENLNEMKKCIEEQNYNLEVSTCDCALNADKDPEFKKICDEKIEKLKTNKRDLTNYLYKIKVCKENDVLNQYLSKHNISKSNRKYTVCKCNEEELEEEIIEKCNEIWDFKNMSSEEQKAFTNATSRCK